MKKFKKILAIVLAAVMALSSVAFADDALDIQPRSDAYFKSYSCTIKIKSSTTYTISFNATATGKMTRLGVTSIDLYKNGKFLDAVEYTDKNRGNMMKYNTTMMSDTELIEGTVGAKYYAVVHFYAKNSSGSATRSVTTKTITLS